MYKGRIQKLMMKTAYRRLRNEIKVIHEIIHRCERLGIQLVYKNNFFL